MNRRTFNSLLIGAALTSRGNLVGGSSSEAEVATHSGTKFYQPPQLFVMTGFIANTTTGVWGADYIVNGKWTHEKQQSTLAAWNKDLGKAYDAYKAVASFKDAGATGVIFYDKWHDGLVLHATKLTSFHTERDLLAPTLKSLRKHNMKAVVYYSVGLDANPDQRFLDWTCLDAQGKRMGKAFENDWKSFYSPYRQYALDQMVEILKNYDTIDGFWFDLYTQPLGSRDKYTKAAFEKRYGKTVEQATQKELEDFNDQTLANYLADIRRTLSDVQPNIGFTWNGAGMDDVLRPHMASMVDSAVDWFSMEGHVWPNIDRGARLGQGSDRPFEVGMLLNSSWYVPMHDQAPPPTMSEAEAIVSAATAWVQGGNLYAAMTPGHSGIFDEKGDLALLRSIGGWLRDNKEWIEGARPYADIGILTGAPSPEISQIPSLFELWRASHWKQGDNPSAPGWEIELKLRSAGYMTERVGGAFKKTNFNLNEYRMLVLPENALLDREWTARLREYVHNGGRLLAFGHSSLLDPRGGLREDFVLADVFGVNYDGTLPGYKQFASMPDSGIISTLSLNPGALAVRRGNARVLAIWRSAGGGPAMVENQFGKGLTIYTTAEEPAFMAGELLEELIGRMIGGPSVRIEGKRDYILQMNRKGQDLVLYVLNRSTGSRANHAIADFDASATCEGPEHVKVMFDSVVLGPVRTAEIIPGGSPVLVSWSTESTQMMLDASPSVTAVLLRRGARE